MGSDDQGKIQSLSDGGVVGEHPPAEPFQFLAAPATSAEFNTARLRLIPIACFRIDDVRFKFDSSFILPSIAPELKALARLLAKDANKGAPLSIFGHADPTFEGNFERGSSTAQSGDDYNKVLSGRRAIAVYALLIRDPSFWNTLYSNHLGGDVWGEASIRVMLDRTDPPSPSPSPNSSSPGGSNTASSGSARNARVRDIANDSGQRQQLFLKYMNLLSGDLKLDKSKDFLARGAGPDQKGDVQGCSRFNPLLLFSQEDEAQFKIADHQKDKAALAARNKNNAPNRRVMILIFRKGSQILPAKWPCPSYKEGAAACKKRFFSDGEHRRSSHLPGVDRKFTESRDTFACRFYQRISDNSPCQGTTGFFGKLFMQILDLDGRALLSNRKYTIRLSHDIDSTFTGVLNEDGILLHEFVPDANYVLKVDGCDDESPMIVLDPSDPVPTVRCLETSALKMFITTTDGIPIEGATVNVNGIGELKSDADGVADFGLVKPGEFDFRVTKTEFVADKGVTKDSASSALVGGSNSSFFADIISLNDSANGKVLVANRKAKPVATLNAKVAPTIVKSIKASIRGTFSTRTSLTKTLGVKSLSSSSSNASTPIDAVVLVRCDAELELEAVTEPPGQSVNWAVVPNQSSATPPAITPILGGTKANLKFDKAGSFSASATIGSSTILWNFVVVGLTVDVANAKINTRDTFVDGGIFLKTHPNPQGFNLPKDFFAAFVGEFAFGKHAWDSEVTVKYTGGGPKGDVGLAKVTPFYSQNITSSDVRGKYDGGAKGFNHLRQDLTFDKKILDVGGPAGSGPGPQVGITTQGTPQWPVTTAPGMVNVSPLDPATNSRVIKMGDSPASGAFEKQIRNRSTLKTQNITHIEGFTKFLAAIVSFSEDAPNVVVVHAVSEWLADYQGHIEFPFAGDDHYVKDFAHMTIVNKWSEVGPATGGMDAGNAGFEIFGPLATTVSNQPQDNEF